MFELSADNFKDISLDLLSDEAQDTKLWNFLCRVIIDGCLVAMNPTDPASVSQLKRSLSGFRKKLRLANYSELFEAACEEQGIDPPSDMYELLAEANGKTEGNLPLLIESWMEWFITLPKISKWLRQHTLTESARVGDSYKEFIVSLGKIAKSPQSSVQWSPLFGLTDGSIYYLKEPSLLDESVMLVQVERDGAVHYVQGAVDVVKALQWMNWTLVRNSDDVAFSSLNFPVMEPFVKSLV